jgi:hypothetical protein
MEHGRDTTTPTIKPTGQSIQAQASIQHMGQFSHQLLKQTHYAAQIRLSTIYRLATQLGFSLPPRSEPHLFSLVPQSPPPIRRRRLSTPPLVLNHGESLYISGDANAFAPAPSFNAIFYVFPPLSSQIISKKNRREICKYLFHGELLLPAFFSLSSFGRRPKIRFARILIL